MGNLCLRKDLKQHEIDTISSPIETSSELKNSELRNSIVHKNKQTTKSTTEIEKNRKQSINKISKFMRSKKALTDVQTESYWKIFASLDTMEENEMLQLSSFLTILSQRIPILENEQKRMSRKTIMETKLEFVQTKAHEVQYSSFEKSSSSPEACKAAQNMIDNFKNDKDYKASPKVVMTLLKRSYGHFNLLKNICYLDIPTEGKLTIVGDIHGQVKDLLHILDESGFPSSTNKYIFNGDFVDRGNNGVGVLTILFSLIVAQPDNVILLRGNHEDENLCHVYGFEDECRKKYNDLIYGMFIEVFKSIPLFSVVDHTIFIVHGGLFHDQNITLNELMQIDRKLYVAKPFVPYPDNTTGQPANVVLREKNCELMRDALWSDPQKKNGKIKNSRGAGILFGPDITEEFLKNNNLKMIIRSHECVRRGYELSHEEESSRMSTRKTCDRNEISLPSLITLFSASNYGGHDINDGAYLIATKHKHTDSHQIKNNLHYSINTYNILVDENLVKTRKTMTSRESLNNMEKNNKNSLTDFMIKKKKIFLIAFEAYDVEQRGRVSRNQWAEIMAKVTNIHIRWLTVVHTVVEPQHITPTEVFYSEFLNSFTYARSAGDEHTDIRDVLYANRRTVEAVFRYFDKDNNKLITREDFISGCDALNSEDKENNLQLLNPEKLFKMMGIGGSPTIDLNMFFECFRLAGHA